MRLYKSYGVALAVGLAALAVHGQETPALAGRWEGILSPKPARKTLELSTAKPMKLPTVVVITGTDGKYSGTWITVSQNSASTPIDVTVEGDTVRISVPAWGGSYEGTLSEDGSKLDGKWRQRGATTPFVLTKVAAAL